jgi:hypothetical protein
MPDNRREFLAKMLAIVPASIVGRGFMKSANVPKAVAKIDTPIVLSDHAHKLPQGWHLYEIGGQCLFPMYGGNGGLCTRQVAYLVRRQRERLSPVLHYNVDGGPMGRGIPEIWEDYYQCIPIEFNDEQFIAMDYGLDGATELINKKIAYAIAHRAPRRASMNGGCLPRVSQEEREHEALYFSGKLFGHLTGVYPQLTWNA